MSGIPAGAGALIGKQLGQYEVLALLALGGTAEIYLARMGGASGFEKYVVVKCLHDHLADDPEFVKMFLDEARLAAILDHSNIVQTMALGEHESRYYMVMEYLAGLSLAMTVRRAAEHVPGGKIPVPLILNIAAQAAAGLHYAHERTANGKPLNMVHRDISPQNLVIGFEGVVKVVDFGIARAEVRDTKTKAGTIKGKFAYMSPEQCIAANVDRRTDVFALGVIIHELLTGRRLFKRNSPYETYQAVLECNVPVPSSVNHELDPGLDAIVMKAVAKDKDVRWPTAEALGDALQAYMHRQGKQAGPGEVGRFFEQHFQADIEEHFERMRELIAGREVEGAGWDGDEQIADEEIQELSSLEEIDEVVDHIETNDLEADDAETGDGDAGPPAQKTRIEMNPLELLKELDEKSALQPKPKFPAAAQLPTMIAPEPQQPAPSQRPTAPELKRRTPPAQMPTMITPAAGLPAVAPPTRPTMQDAAIAPGDFSDSGETRELHRGAYPMVQPPGAATPSPQAMPPHPAMPPQAMPPGMNAASPYPMIAGGRPYSTDIAPSVPPHGGARPPQSAPRFPEPTAPPMAPSPGFMSPVGDTYRGNVDWNAAARQRARALAPWQLAVLFVGVLGAALLLTIIIAKLAR